VGIVVKQAGMNALMSYIGAALGFITVAFVNIKLLSTEQNGLLNLLISISIVTGSLSNLGMAGVISRMFPHFRNAEKNHHGFLYYPLIVTLLGFVGFLILFFIFKDSLVARNYEKSRLFADEIIYLVPLTFFWAIFNIFDSYSRSVYRTVAGVFIKEVLLRVVILVAALFLFLGTISFSVFLGIYCASFCSIAILLGIHLWRKNELHIKRDTTYLTPTLKKEMRSVAFYSIITGLSKLVISSIDKVLVNDKLGLSAAGVFAIATYFGSIIHIPARSIVRIAAPVIADSWKNNDLQNIKTVYHKTCLNQFIFGVYMLGGIFLCIDEVMEIMPAAYSQGKYVILLVGLGYLIDMATGANGIIIGTSRYFRYDTYFMLLLVVVTVLTNLWLIPLYGIVGSALAMCITYFLFNLLRYIFIWKKFGMQPYDKAFLKVALALLLALAIAWWPSVAGAPFITIIIKGSIFSLVFVVLIYTAKVANELNAIANKYLLRIKN
jgi:O-antigen/teichoic acid export membrane protein